jgi:hypothetical protein
MITYYPMADFITVKIEGKVAGGIYQVPGGFAYKTKSNHWGETFPTIAAVKRSLEGE